MTFKQIAAILAVILQVLNGVLSLGAGVIPIKYATIIATVVGIIQSILPRIQGSTATDMKPNG